MSFSYEILTDDVGICRLRTWSGSEGAVRLSTDEGPPAHDFLQDDLEDAEERGEVAADDDNETLAQRALRLKQADTAL